MSSRLQRTSKVRALDQVKAWCGADDGEPAAKKVKKELSSEDEDYSDPDSTKGTPQYYSLANNHIGQNLAIMSIWHISGVAYACCSTTIGCCDDNGIRLPLFRNFWIIF